MPLRPSRWRVRSVESIEDFDPDGGLYEPRHAADRIGAAADAAGGLGFPFILTARAENHIRGNPDLADTIARLQLYEEAGADVLYARDWPPSRRSVRSASSVSRPVNVLALGDLTVAEIVDAGAQRVSVGGGLTWVGVAAMAAAASSILETGDLSSMAADVPLDRWFA